jgi:hypothetical protein
MFRFMQRFGRDSRARWRGTGAMTCVRRRHQRLDCEALEGRQMLSGYYLVNAASGKVLADPGSSTANRTSVIQYQYNGGTKQQWSLVKLADGNYAIVNAFSGKVLDDPDFSTANRTSVIQYHYNGGTNQQWRLYPLADGNYAIFNVFSGKVLDDPDFSTANRTSVIQYQYNGGTNQQWALFAPNGGAGTSNNWSGYVAETNFASPQTNSVSAVYGSWIVPTVTGPSSGSAHSAVWVGIDGWLGSTVEQIGTEQDVVNGTPSYRAWWEMWSTGKGQPQQFISSMTIKPGDSISASVHYLTSGPSAGQFQLAIEDYTQNESFIQDVSSANTQSPQAQRSSAEWIVEAPEFPPVGGTIANLANFGDVKFTDAGATINNVNGPIDASSWQSNAFNITGNASTNATTSVLNDSGGASGVSSFYVLANSTSLSGAKARTNVGTATGTDPAVGVTHQSGTKKGAPANGRLARAQTLSPSRHGALIGRRGRPAQGLSSDLVARDAIFADYDPMEYHLMSGGRQRGRVLGGPTSTGE